MSMTTITLTLPTLLYVPLAITWAVLTFAVSLGLIALGHIYLRCGTKKEKRLYLSALLFVVLSVIIALCSSTQSN